MSVEQADTIDLIGVEAATGKVVLTISDHLDWDENNEHVLILQDKINSYLAFIESGELVSAYPDGEGRVPVIEVVMRLPPPQVGLEFLNRVGAILGPTGIELRHRVLER